MKFPYIGWRGRHCPLIEIIRKDMSISKRLTTVSTYPHTCAVIMKT